MGDNQLTAQSLYVYCALCHRLEHSTLPPKLKPFRHSSDSSASTRCRVSSPASHRPNLTVHTEAYQQLINTVLVLVAAD